MAKTDWLTARARRAWQLRQQGTTYTKIGVALGQLGDPSVPISRTAASQLVQRWEARRARPIGIPVTMTERAYSVLTVAAERAGEPISRLFARTLIETEALLTAENCGAITLEEIRKWAYSDGREWR